MKRLIFLTTVLLAMALGTRPALAMDLPRTEQGGFLILLFLGVFALIIVTQMVPALILAMEAISRSVRKAEGKKQMVLAAAQQDRNK